MLINERMAQVCVVLKDTTHPGNIGAAARAMKTMGCANLRLAAAKTRIDGTSRAMSAHALDVLQDAAFYDTLDAAVADCTHVFAFTARRRELSPVCLTPRQMGEEAIRRIDEGGKTALLFGGERSGLENEDIQRAGFVVEIPTNPDYTSLNLAQSVQLAMYETRVAALAAAAAKAAMMETVTENSESTESGEKQRDMPTQEEFDAMIKHMQQAMRAVGLPKDGSNKMLLPRWRQILTRAELDRSETRLVRGLWKAILETIEGKTDKVK